MGGNVRKEKKSRGGRNRNGLTSEQETQPPSNKNVGGSNFIVVLFSTGPGECAPNFCMEGATRKNPGESEKSQKEKYSGQKRLRCPPREARGLPLV